MESKTYKVLIVDDEEKDRRIVDILLQRQYGGLFQVLEAKNVAEARGFIQREQVDLLIADIHMPGSSGLVLVKEIRAKEMKMYIMMLTAFNYFEYAKEAIRYQVNDFILKPPIRKEFYEAVQRFLDWAKEESGGHEIDQEARAVFIRELGDCIMLNAEKKKLSAYRDLLHIQEEWVFCILIDTRTSENLKDASFQDEIEEAMNAIAIPYAVSHMQDRSAIFCFTRQDAPRYDALSVTVELKMRLSMELCEQETITVGDTVSIYDTPSRSYLQAFTQLNNLQKIRGDESNIEDRIVTGIKSGDTKGALRLFGQYLLQYGQAHRIDDLMLKDIELLTVIRKSLQVREEAIGAKMVDIFVTGSLQDILHFSTDYLREIAEKASFEAIPKKHYAVRNICEQVRAHVEQNWSIHDFAREYGFNPFYLSRLFKEETGLCFTDYLTEKRVEKAVELMGQTNLSIGEIGMAVGYSDQNYFSRVFKKKNLLGPKEYRRLQREKHETGPQP